MAHSYKDLKVWQKARPLVKEVYRISAGFPDSERYGLTNQIRRSAISVPSNIAEGHARYSTKDYMRFINIALGSLAERETQIILATDLSFCTVQTCENTVRDVNELERMLRSLHTSLKNILTEKPLIP